MKFYNVFTTKYKDNRTKTMNMKFKKLLTISPITMLLALVLPLTVTQNVDRAVLEESAEQSMMMLTPVAISSVCVEPDCSAASIGLTGFTGLPCPCIPGLTDDMDVTIAFPLLIGGTIEVTTNITTDCESTASFDILLPAGVDCSGDIQLVNIIQDPDDSDGQGSCPEQVPFSSLFVSIAMNPEASVNGPYGPFCLDDPLVQLDGSPSPDPRQTGFWTGAGVIDASVLDSFANFSPILAGIGIHEVMYQFTNNTGCLDMATVLIEVYDSPLATAGDDQDACNNETIQIHSAIVGGVMPYTILWSATSGSFEDPSQTDPLYTADGTGPDTLVISVMDANGCASTDTVLVTAIDAPTIDIGGDTTVCSNGGLQFFANAAGGASPYVYSWQATSGSFSDPSSTNPVYSNDVPGIYELTLFVIDQNGCQVDSTIEITVNEATDADLGGNQVVCANQDLDLDATVTGGAMPYAYAWVANGGTFSDTAVQDPIYMNDVPGAYVLTLTVTEATGCETIESIVVTVLDSLDIELDERILVCENSSSTLQLEVSGGTPPYTYFWTNTGGSFDDPTVEDPTYNSIIPGLYLVHVDVRDAFGCGGVVGAIIEVGSDFDLELGIDTFMCANSPFLAEAEITGGNGPFTYTWTASNGTFTDPAAIVGEYINDVPGSYEIYVEVVDSFGCVNMDTLPIVVNEPPYVEGGLNRTICNDEPIVLTPTILAPNAPLIYLWTDNGAAGGFSDPTVPNPTYANLNSGIHVLTLTVTDAFGCIGLDSINVIVNQEPFFQNCPDTLVFGNDEDQCGAFANWQAPIGLDHCNLNVTVAQTEGPTPGTRLLIDSFYQVTYVVTAEEGSSASCSFVVLVKDTECPEFITNLPEDVTLTCVDIPEPFEVIPAWHTSDNCTESEDVIVTFREDTTHQTCANSYTLKRYWTAMDQDENSCDYVQKITVIDTIAPSFTVPVNDSVSCSELADLDTSVYDISDQCTADSLLTIGFVDISTQSTDSTDCGFYSYSIERQFYVEDECRNSNSISQEIIVTDDAIPMATCLNISVYLDETGMAIITPADVDDASADACAQNKFLDYRLSQDTFICAHVGENNVILYITDPCGNEGACVSTVTVMDTFVPVLECPKDWIFTLSPGECGKFLHSEPVISDNCNTSWVSIPEDGSFIPIGINDITIIVTDDGGNTAECTYSIDVREYPNPINSMSCNNRINLSLNEDCEATITADMILEGGPYGCYDDFEIYVINSAGDTMHSTPHAGIDDIGEEFTVSILNPENGNSCWGTVLIEQKLDPVVVCPADTIVPCTHGAHPDFTGYPFVTSCEPFVDISYEDDVTDNGSCGEPRREIIRTWTIVDESGNEVICVQSIQIDRFDLGLVDFPEDFTTINDMALDCYDVSADPSLIEPLATGFPSLMGAILNPDEQTLCDYTLSHWDKVQEGCGNSFTILRLWQILDVCSEIEEGVNPIAHTQFIHVADLTPPVVTYPEDVTLYTEVFNCVSNWTIPDPVVEDCSPFSYRVSATAGTIIDLNPGFILTGLDEGELTLTYAIEDFCGNITKHDVNITVIDNIPPTPVCDEYTVVSLTTDGVAHAKAESFDDGSHDNCGPVFFKVIKRRDLCDTNNGLDTPFNGCASCASQNGDDDELIAGEQIYFDDYVEFCCEEVGETLLIVLRVFDTDPGEGPVAPSRMEPGGVLYQSFNDCEVEAAVEDRLPPFIACPPSLTISCDFSYNLDSISDLNNTTFGTIRTDDSERQEISVPGHGNPIYADDHVFGYDGLAADNCSVELGLTVRTDIACGQGVIRRTFTATDAAGNVSTCEQRIFFESFDPFGLDDIDFPADVTITDVCVDAVLADPDATGSPDWGADVCSDILLSSEDELFYDDADACVKIFRTWKLIDWCQYDENTGEGIFTDLQIIKVANGTDPEIETCADVIVCDTTATDCFTFVDVQIAATDDCTTDDNIEFSYEIDNFFEDDGDPDDFDADIPSTPFATASAGGNDASGTYPFGRHKIRWSVQDGCGNVSICEYILDLKDCKKPSPKCFSGIVTVLMESSGEVTIWASDFDAGSDDNCGDVTASFSEDVTNTNITFTCDDLGSTSVMVYFTDESGNQEFCETFLFIQDNGGVCGGFDGGITGFVRTQEGETLMEAEINLDAIQGGDDRVLMTNSIGEYSFFAVPFFSDYEITGFKNDDPSNGISGLDLVRIQRHLLGLEPFTTPYQYIAGDVNNSESVSAVDLVQLRQLLLGIEPEFPNNTSWRFIDATMTFPDIDSPWPLDEVVFLEDFQTDWVDEQNFTAIKVGDLNGSAETSGLTETEDRAMAGSLVLYTSKQKFRAGDRVSVALSCEDFSEFIGLQFALEWDPEMISLNSWKGEAIELISGVTVNDRDEGLWKISWSELSPNDAVAFSKIISFEFIALRSGTIQDLLHFNDEALESEAYDMQLNVYDIDLEFRDHVKLIDTDQSWNVEQNSPNPFEDITIIPFTLAEEADVSIDFINSSGASVYELKGHYAAGKHQLEVKASDLGKSGVWIYELKAKGRAGKMLFTDAKKMILLD